MTLPHERHWALKNALRFLQDLMDRTKTKRVPMEIRRQARGVLKHFPHDFDIDRITDACEEYAGSIGRDEPVMSRPKGQGRGGDGA